MLQDHNPDVNPPAPLASETAAMLRTCRLLVAIVPLLALPYAASAQHNSPTKRIAAVVTEYRDNSHADVIVGRLLDTHTLDGQGRVSPLKLLSLYTDQVPENDLSRSLAQTHQFKIYPTVAETLTLGGDQLAVDGVLLVAEHGKYPRSETSQVVYPKRRLFEQVVQTFQQSGRVVPVFIDKHLADNWQDAKWIYDTAKQLEIPLMAGSSLPTTWRYPPVDVQQGARLKQVVAVSYHTLDAYGFHALEMLQAIVERRAGGETGIKRVQCVTGDAVWQAGEKQIYDPELLSAALSRLEHRRRPEKPLQELVKEPILFVIDYADGLRANVLTLNGAVGEWSIAWRHDDGSQASTLFYTQEREPFLHFSFLTQGIEQMIVTGKPAWPVERTLLVSGLLDALLISKQQGGKPLATPQLTFSYDQPWHWQQPFPEPPERAKVAGKGN
jgi:hypothetical protein